MTYSWLRNVAHEIAGTAMFGLLVIHNVFNRRWYGTLAKRRPGAPGIVTRTINLSLLAMMLGLLVTSVVISQSVFAFLPIAATFTARQLHTMAAYLVLLVAAALPRPALVDDHDFRASACRHHHRQPSAFRGLGRGRVRNRAPAVC
jgi:hypothetical protein